MQADSETSCEYSLRGFMSRSSNVRVSHRRYAVDERCAARINLIARAFPVCRRREIQYFRGILHERIRLHLTAGSIGERCD